MLENSVNLYGCSLWLYGLWQTNKLSPYCCVGLLARTDFNETKHEVHELVVISGVKPSLAVLSDIKLSVWKWHRQEVSAAGPQEGVV